MEDLTLKVVIQKVALAGIDDDRIRQRVATVYVQTPVQREYRVYAPPRAIGNALEWVDHFTVLRPGRENPEFEQEADPSDRVLMVEAVKEELERLKRAEDNRPVGIHPDGFHHDACVCLQGHVMGWGGSPFSAGEHCPRCGEPCIDSCPNCSSPIRGPRVGTRVGVYNTPSFCHKCGSPYPWMKDKLETARDLLYNDDKLTMEDRNRLWELLKYVMSDPKSDLVPAKRKLIEINIAKAASTTRELVLDFLAKYLAEVSKP